MRDLIPTELVKVSGAGRSPAPPTCPPATRTKNNNGYGNGAESGPAPGKSGQSAGNAFQGFEGNFGPRGAR